MYKLYHLIHQGYSNGGTMPKWTKKGKIWRRLGDLKAHLTLVCEKKAYFDDLHNWEIVELEMSEKRRVPVAELHTHKRRVGLIIQFGHPNTNVLTGIDAGRESFLGSGNALPKLGNFHSIELRLGKQVVDESFWLGFFDIPLRKLGSMGAVREQFIIHAERRAEIEAVWQWMEAKHLLD